MSDQFMTRIHSGEGRLSLAEQALAGARSAFATATDRSRYGTDEAHAASFGEHEPALREAEQAAVTAAEQVAQDARQIAQQARTAPPTLTDAEFAAANNRAAFVVEDAKALPLGELRDRMAHALTTDDRVTLYLLSREIPKRLAAADGGQGFAAGEAEALRELSRMVGEARDRLADRRLEAVATRAAAVRDRAIKLRSDAERQQRAAETERAMELILPAGAVLIPDEV